MTRSSASSGWRIEWSEPAVKALKKLDPPVSRRIVRFLDELIQGDPRRQGVELKGAANAWRYRVGDWRIIVSLQDVVKVVAVVRIGHRREVYR